MKCKSCGAVCEWAVTDAARKMLVDPPTEDGNLFAWRSPDGTLRVSAREPLSVATVKVTSHFATCPNADSHRKPR